MEDNCELIGHLSDSKLLAIKRRYTYSIITNIILILVFVVIAAYIYSNIEAFKTLGQDVCAMCMNKTGIVYVMP